MTLGLKVRCVDESDTTALVHGCIYMVCAVSPLGTAVTVSMDGRIVEDDVGHWFHVSRFEPLFSTGEVTQ